MELKFIDPRALKENPDKARRSKSNPQADALLLATIKAIGIVQPPVVASETDGGNGFVIDAGQRRVKQAVAAGLEEIAVLVVDRTEDGGAMRSLAESLAHEPLNPSISGVPSNGSSRSAGPRRRSASRWRSPFAKFASFACSPMCCRR